MAFDLATEASYVNLLQKKEMIKYFLYQKSRTELLLPKIKLWLMN